MTHVGDPVIATRPVADCAFDVVSLGEVMLRLDPGETRIRAARRFDVWEGGGEYNLARALSSVFELRAGVVTALVDNEVGRLVESLVRAGGVDTSLIRWEDFDGLGRRSRNGLNFTERGFGVRSALGVSDRAGTAVSQLAPGTIDWDDLFGRRGVRWLHTGGVFAGLSATTSEVAHEAMASARAHGTVVSYDTNYRPSLWADRGGHGAARALNNRLVQHVDVLIGTRSDFSGALGQDGRGDPDAPWTPPDPAADPYDALSADAQALADQLPGLQVVASTRRTVHSANDNDWQGAAWSRTAGLAVSVSRPHLSVLDRVGGGDGFAAGLAYGLLGGEDLAACVELGAAHGALAMSTPGDTSMASLAEVRALALGGDASTRR
ncbi:sugar kinase [Nocardioides sp. Root190]|uniref:sugar kinase n=1 Tax=Nocardioides sp. Root190 TaxID=1736488 RepID=UPI0007014DEC|nr:sugar kinase [Nocardioides sp. Root190]KRB76181.1 sugar kinase [Nocardioides sp. Root190]